MDAHRSPTRRSCHCNCGTCPNGRSVGRIFRCGMDLLGSETNDWHRYHESTWRCSPGIRRWHSNWAGIASHASRLFIRRQAWRCITIGDSSRRDSCLMRCGDREQRRYFSFAEERSNFVPRGMRYSRSVSRCCSCLSVVARLGRLSLAEAGWRARTARCAACGTRQWWACGRRSLTNGR